MHKIITLDDTLRELADAIEDADRLVKEADEDDVEYEIGYRRGLRLAYRLLTGNPYKSKRTT